MDSSPEYTIEHALYLGAATAVHRARRVADGRPVVLKVSLDDERPVHHVSRYHNEFQLLRELDHEHIVQAYALEQVHGRLVLVLEDVGGESLRRWAGEERLPLGELLAVAVRVAHALRAVHAAGVIHRDVNPDNIVYAAANGVVRLIDFGIATRDFDSRVVSGHAFEGTLPYLSPEQTGRVGCPIDRRTDFYSFGATLYELLLGRPPHVGADPMEIVHAHLAVAPVPPHAIDARIPEALSQIVVKLLSKSPGERYQSARGLEADLRECARQWEASGAIEAFTLGSHDVRERFEVSRVLYGREAELALLHEALARVTDDRSPETVLVAGYSGVGKSSVVRELQAAVTARGGYFVTGKFDQLRRAIPYGGLLPALRELVDQLLAEDAVSVARWREQLREALGGNGKVVAEVIPEIELLTGPFPPLPELGPIETQNRFRLTFRDFMGVFCRREHPLVLFLDDMQWADSATLDMLDLLLTNGSGGSLLLLQAYRDNEVDAGHPFMRAIEEQRRRGARVSTIAIAPLGERDVTALVADTLGQPATAVAPLAEVVWRKTGGNPFFVGEFLHTLADEQLIAFDEEQGAFTFDLEPVGGLGITDNLGDLLARQLDKLPAETRRALRLAAAIGGRFDLAMLSIVAEEPVQRLENMLRSAVSAELIAPSLELVSVDPSVVDAPLVPRHYVFRHDRIQLAAYSTIPEAERDAVHLAIGRLLLADIDAEERTFDIVGHLNRAAAAIEDPQERMTLGRLNLRAAGRARASGAYGVAAGYFAAGLEHLGEAAWTDDYAQCLAAHRNWAECAALTADFDAAFAVVDRALPHARSQPDRGRLLSTRAGTLVAAGKMAEACACGIEAAACFGVELPRDPASVGAQIQSQLGRVFERIAGDGIDSLLALPAMRDPDVIAAVTLLVQLVPAAYQNDPPLFMLLTTHIVTLSLEHGNCPASAFGYTALGCGLNLGVGDRENGFAFGRVGVELNRRLDDHTFRASTFFVFAAMVSPWREPSEHSVALFAEAIKEGLQSGDFPHAGYAAFIRAMRLLYRGTPLPVLEQEIEQVRPLLERLGCATNLASLESLTQAVRSLRGQLPDPQSFDGEGFDEATHEQAISGSGNASLVALFRARQLMHRYFVGRFEEAIEIADDSERYPQYAGFIEGFDMRLFGALARTAVYGSADAERQAAMDAWLARPDLAKVAEECPANLRDRHLLVEAERARIAGDTYRAMQLFDDAIAYASDRQSLMVEALARELAGRMWCEQGRRDLAMSYLRGARQTYEQWGCVLKLRLLDAEFPALAGSVSTPIDGRAITSTTRRFNGALDLASVVKASQAIAAELRLDALLATLMRIILANAGADCGSLVLADDDGLRVQAFAGVNDESTAVMQATPLAEAPRLSEGIVNYVARTGMTVVEDDPAMHARYRNDAYIQAHRPKSVLAAPVLHKNRLIGVLYLENDLFAGAFTRDRLEAIGILSSQIAVSIENARLFAKEREQAEELVLYRNHLEDLVEERTRELKAMQSRLVDVSRQAGMAEIAVGVLHNVGNSLNSVNVAAEVIDRKLQSSHVSSLGRAIDLLAAQDDVAAFVADDPRGKKIVPYLVRMREVLAQENADLLAECKGLRERIDHIKVVVAQQQEHARAVAVVETTTVPALVDEALALVRPLLSTSIDVATEFEDLPQLEVDRHGVLQILVNLLRNAGQAVEATGRGHGRIGIEARGGDGHLHLTIVDDGVGIPPEHMARIFGYGFTTKAGGHGFGLHNSCNNARTMGGQLRCHSDGSGHGAAFTLTLPMRAAA